MELCKKNAPTGIRIPVLALRGPRPGPLDDGGLAREILSQEQISVNPHAFEHKPLKVRGKACASLYLRLCSQAQLT